MSVVANFPLRLFLASRRRRVLVVIVAIALFGIAGVFASSWSSSSQLNSIKGPDTSVEKSESGVVRLPVTKWSTAGIKVETVCDAPLTERVWRSGHLVLDESRVAHISPTVEGVIREVKVRLGQEVKEGDVLAYLDCREVGQAKLELVKARLATRFAQAQHEWTQSTTQTASELVEALSSNESVSEIERRFKDRPIGDLRQQLITAYSRRLQTRAHYEAVSLPDSQGAVPQSSVIRMKADFEAAEATFRALCEEARFQTIQQARTTEQKLREAQTAEALARSTLMMLGYSQEEVAALDPIAEGVKVSLYPIRAPFAGTIIEQHAVLAERVGSQLQMFKIANLSTLWLQADVPQKDVPIVREMAGSKLKFRIVGEDRTLYEAKVFYTGDVIDPNTRAISLTASVPNPDRSLKPGSFVDVELSRSRPIAVQVPLSAIQREGTQTFVFVHMESDRFRRVDVSLGRSSGSIVEISEGLKAGQSVAVAGGLVLKSELFKDRMAGE